MIRVAPCALLIGVMLVLSGCDKSTSQPQPAQQTAKPVAAQVNPAAPQQKPDALPAQTATADKPAAKTVAASDDPFAPVDASHSTGATAAAVDPQGPALPVIDPGSLPDLKAPTIAPVGKDAK
jgi:hypothetical protein